jgi:hypothetical protein
MQPRITYKDEIAPGEIFVIDFDWNFLFQASEKIVGNCWEVWKFLLECGYCNKPKHIQVEGGSGRVFKGMLPFSLKKPKFFFGSETYDAPNYHTKHWRGFF